MGNDTDVPEKDLEDRLEMPPKSRGSQIFQGHDGREPCTEGQLSKEAMRQATGFDLACSEDVLFESAFSEQDEDTVGEWGLDSATEQQLVRSLSVEQRAQILQEVFPDMKLSEVMR